MSGENVTNKKSNSLYTYRDGIDANSNKGWQQYNSSVSSQSQMTAYNTPLFNSASGYPSVSGWPNNWTSSDPILNFGSTSTDLNCGGNGFINTLGYITGGLAAATGLFGLGAGIASLCKKDKSEETQTVEDVANDAMKCDNKTKKDDVLTKAENINIKLKEIQERKKANNKIIGECQAQIEKKTEELKKMKKENANIDKEIETIKGNISKQESIIEENGKAIQGYEKEIAGYDKEISNLQKKLTKETDNTKQTEIRNKITQLQNKKTTAEKNKERATKERDEAIEKKAKLEKELAPLEKKKSDITKLENEIQTLKIDKERAEAQVKEDTAAEDKLKPAQKHLNLLLGI